MAINIGIQPRTVFRKRQMPGIDRDRKVRPAAFSVSRIDSRIQTMLKMYAHRCHQMPACRKSKHSNLVRVDMPLRSVKTY